MECQPHAVHSGFAAPPGIIHAWAGIVRAGDRGCHHEFSVSKRVRMAPKMTVNRFAGGYAQRAVHLPRVWICSTWVDNHPMTGGLYQRNDSVTSELGRLADWS